MNKVSDQLILVPEDSAVRANACFLEEIERLFASGFLCSSENDSGAGSMKVLLLSASWAEDKKRSRLVNGELKTWNGLQALACPFCGKAMIAVEPGYSTTSFRRVFCSCMSCNAKGPFVLDPGRVLGDRRVSKVAVSSIYLALRLWNTRVPASSSPLCPFCGGKPVQESGFDMLDSDSVCCSECGACGPAADSWGDQVSVLWVDRKGP
jgi:hypothetical protein